MTLSPDLDLDLDPAASQVEQVVALLDQALDRPVEVPELAAEQYAALVAACARARSRIQSLELKLIAAADRAGVAAATGLATTGAWVAKQTRADQGDAARQTSCAASTTGGSTTSATTIDDPRREPSPSTGGREGSAQSATCAHGGRTASRELHHHTSGVHARVRSGAGPA
jgi:hypothetical protein